MKAHGWRLQQRTRRHNRQLIIFILANSRKNLPIFKIKYLNTFTAKINSKRCMEYSEIYLPFSFPSNPITIKTAIDWQSVTTVNLLTTKMQQSNTIDPNSDICLNSPFHGMHIEILPAWGNHIRRLFGRRQPLCGFRVVSSMYTTGFTSPREWV